MPSEAHSQVAAQLRQLAAQGRVHGRASELVKLFGVPLTADGVRVVGDALTEMGLETRPPLSADKPKREITIVIAAAAKLPETPVAVDAEPGAKAAPGWYPDPAAPATRRYWDGEAWTDEWSAPETSIATPLTTIKRPPRVWPGALLLIFGAVLLWFAQDHDPTVSNALNGTRLLTSGEYHAAVIVSIVLLVIGGVDVLRAAVSNH